MIFVDFFKIKSLYIYCRGFLELLKNNCENIEDDLFLY